MTILWKSDIPVNINYKHLENHSILDPNSQHQDLQEDLILAYVCV